MFSLLQVAINRNCSTQARPAKEIASQDIRHPMFSQVDTCRTNQQNEYGWKGQLPSIGVMLLIGEMHSYGYQPAPEGDGSCNMSTGKTRTLMLFVQEHDSWSRTVYNAFQDQPESCTSCGKARCHSRFYTQTSFPASYSHSTSR